MIIRDYDFSRHTIQDPIHGAITFGAIEKAVLDHRLFQRLHGLRQNSLLYLVFPAANHTRFDHSLGVMHLADKYLFAIIRNQRQICAAGAKRKSYQEPFRIDDSGMREAINRMSEDEYFRIVIRLAGLFHDAGHGPLSHLFDNFFPNIHTVRSLLRSRSHAHTRAYLKSMRKGQECEPIRHEVLSCMIATRVLVDSCDVLREHGIDPNELTQNVCSVIIDKILPSKRLVAGNYDTSSLLHDIISSDLDADRMDYLLRDSHMCGVNYGLYDPDRILKSMCAYGRSDSGSMRVAIRYSGLGALEDLLFSRYQMHSQIYGHKTNRACTAMLEGIRARLKKAGWDWTKGCRTEDDFLNRFAEFNDHSFINQLIQGRLDGRAGKVREIAEKLFIERKLVKRVFEERVRQTTNQSPRETEIAKRWEEHQRQLKRKHIWSAPDVFENKGPNLSDSDCYLKVLRKDPHSGYYMVHELSKLSTVVHYLPKKELIYRLYCKGTNVKEAKSMVPSDQ